MKLAIGTVQFGLNYGIMNTIGQTMIDEASRILHVAKLFGIDMLDTAVAYGESEQVLGKIGVSGWKVVSKVPPMPNQIMNGREWVVRHARQSLNRLRVDRLEGLLLHRATDLLGPQGHNIIVGLQQVKAEGMVCKIGLSVYSPQILSELIGIISPDLIQAPFNIFDQRMVTTGWLARLVDVGIEVHVRSIFLQGLLLMGRDKRPAFFDRWNDVWQRWDSLVTESGGSALSLCLGFVNAYPSISRIIVGVENLLHLEELLEGWKKSVSINGAVFSCDDPMLIEPFNWQIK